MARLMVVEDDETIGGHLESSLRSHGYQVVWQRTGQGALRESESGELDLVLLDLGLPDLDGSEVCRQLRGRLPGSVLVMLTARDEEMERRRRAGGWSRRLPDQTDPARRAARPDPRAPASVDRCRGGRRGHSRDR